MYKQMLKEKALQMVEEGATVTHTAEFIGVSRRTLHRWIGSKRALERPSASPVSLEVDEKGEPMEESDLYAPPRSGPLAGLEPSQIENLLLRAVLADLKAEGWAPDSISNRSKCELGERLRMATGLPLRSITGFLRISKSSYEHHRARLGHDKYAHLREEARSAFDASDRTFGYRRIWATLKRGGVRVPEKVVRRIMREEELEVVRPNRPKKYCSYKGEITDAPADLVRHRFSADAPDEVWLTDMTEFALPNGSKVYLHPVIDAFDGAPVSWRIGRRPSKELSDGSLRDAIARKREGSCPIIHSDRGVHYRIPSWIELCKEAGLARSMPRKGCCADNSACEGFFGRLKTEFYYGRDWRGVSASEFMARLDAFLRYYFERRIKKRLGWLSPKEYRSHLGYSWGVQENVRTPNCHSCLELAFLY